MSHRAQSLNEVMTQNNIARGGFYSIIRRKFTRTASVSPGPSNEDPLLTDDEQILTMDAEDGSGGIGEIIITD